jgi:hypothetical protein
MKVLQSGLGKRKVERFSAIIIVIETERTNC